MLPQSFSAKGVRASGIKYGALAGFIAAWSISTAIAASELELGLPVSTFYAIMGMSLGVNDFVSAAYMGFGLHLLTSALLGAAIGFATSRYATKVLMSPYRSTLLGVGAGMVVWLVLFLPLTILLVQPAISRLQTQSEVFESVGQFTWGIALSAIAFHLVWGAIFGYIASSLMQIRALRAAHPKGDVL
jgi:hypothetical protein